MTKYYYQPVSNGNKINIGHFSHVAGHFTTTLYSAVLAYSQDAMRGSGCTVQYRHIIYLNGDSTSVIMTAFRKMLHTFLLLPSSQTVSLSHHH